MPALFHVSEQVFYFLHSFPRTASLKCWAEWCSSFFFCWVASNPGVVRSRCVLVLPPCSQTVSRAAALQAALKICCHQWVWMLWKDSQGSRNTMYHHLCMTLLLLYFASLHLWVNCFPMFLVFTAEWWSKMTASAEELLASITACILWLCRTGPWAAWLQPSAQLRLCAVLHILIQHQTSEFPYVCHEQEESPGGKKKKSKEWGKKWEGRSQSRSPGWLSPWWVADLVCAALPAECKLGKVIFLLWVTGKAWLLSAGNPLARIKLLNVLTWEILCALDVMQVIGCNPVRTKSSQLVPLSAQAHRSKFGELAMIWILSFISNPRLSYIFMIGLAV